VRIGPEDALLHVSQIMDDFITYDEKHGVLAGRESHRNLGKGNMVRGRIIAVSFPRGGSGGKIGITLRQPFLGRIEWIQRTSKGSLRSWSIRLDRQSMQELPHDKCRTVCPNCKSTNLSDDWTGFVVVLEPANSEVAT